MDELVICIENFKPYFGNELPVKGCVYTIREVFTFGNLVGYRFMEIRNEPKPSLPDGSLCESAFLHSAFRPVKRPSIEALKVWEKETIKNKVLITENIGG